MTRVGPRRRAAWGIGAVAALLLAAVVVGLVPRSVPAVPAAKADPVARQATRKVAAPAARAARVPHRGTVYLTFDDGPDPRWTPQVLQILRRHGIKAVFFEIGQNVAAHPELTRRVRRAGHLVGNHTWSHPDLTTLSGRAVRAQLDRTERALGGRPRCVRPPYGATDDRIARIIRNRGQRSVLWDVDPRDWALPGTARIVRRVLDQVHPGARILMHDGGGDRSETVAALDLVITRLLARGYTFGLLAC